MLLKSIVSLGLSFVILFSSTMSIRAAEATNAAYFVHGTYWDQMLIGLVQGVVEWPFGDVVQDVAATVCGEVCPSSADGLHRTSRAGLLGRPVGFHPDFGRYGVAVCDHCGKEFKLYSEDLSERGRGFVDGLDYTTVNSDGLFSVYPAAWQFSKYNDSADDVSSFVSLSDYFNSSDIQSYPGGFDFNGVCLKTGSFYAWFQSEVFSLSPGSYKFYVDFSNGLHSWKRLFGSSDGTAWKQVALVTSVGGSASFSVSDYKYFFVHSYSKNTSFSVGNSYSFSLGSHIDCLSLTSPLPDSFGSDSRPTSVMDVINQWNKDNPLTTNSTTINYYIMPTGTEDLYSPALYDEEELVYTDPVTGTEYLTTGWTYDYLTRCYTLDMADGFTIGDAAIDTIKLTYGDELLTVDHYSGGSLIRSDEYNYVMASGSECGLNGHSYTYENVKDPTCTTMGERKYTCSVCGDQYAENVPASGHTHVFSILKEATCTAAGIGVYSCSTCGSEYTEPIPATNHTGVLLETVPSEFDENGVLISLGYSVYECSVCGTQYTVQDEISTDDGDWFSFMGDLLKSFLKTIVTALGAGLSKLFSAIADFFAWIFGFLSETVLGGIRDFFDSFGDDSPIFDGFRQENEDGSTTVALPSGVATVFQFVSGTILLLPDDLRLVLFFGVAALFLIAVFKSRP